nr:exodeoxyribonuclease VII large subunit [Oceanococcus sp. HetDA_MAG_MS8]
MQDADTSSKTPFQVSELLGLVQHRLDGHFGLVRVEGEVSGLSQPRSGHRYFALKDADGQLRCAWFRHAIRGQTVAEGEQVLVQGKLAIYAPRGDFQLIVQSVQPAGEGALAAAFARLKRKLEQEGLFAAERKPALPKQIRRIGIISSPEAAALQDVLVTLRRRDPFMQVRLFPSSVQGARAVDELVDALAEAGADPSLDVILITRGGGSLEDLQAFNHETLARAIAASPCPVVSAVGHETDLSIADCVASLRAATPTAAAELLSPDRRTDMRRLQDYKIRLNALLKAMVRQKQDRLATLNAQLQRQSPQRRLDLTTQRLDEARDRLIQAQSRRLQLATAQINTLQHRLMLRQPQAMIRDKTLKLKHLKQALLRAHTQGLAAHARHLQNHRARLAALSPRAVLERGYTLVYHKGELVTRAQQWPKQGKQLEVHWVDGVKPFTLAPEKTTT